MPPERFSLDRRLALRIALLGAVALCAFAALFFRLWEVQILRSGEALSQARVNHSRTVPVPAPRGDIVDRNGVTLVTSRQLPAVEIVPSRLSQAERDQAARWGQRAGRREREPRGRRGPPIPVPPPADRRLRRTLSLVGQVVGEPPRTLHARLVRGLAQVPYANVTVTRTLTPGQLGFLAEHMDRLHGAVIAERPRRDYPRGSLAAHVLGTTGEIGPRQRRLRRFGGLEPGSVVGQDGVEWTYDRYLRGVDGRRQYIVDANGAPQTQRVVRRPRPGGTLRLTLDSKLQHAGEQAVRRAIAASGGHAGAFVALDPRTGAVRAMGSAPTFDPRALQRPMSADEYERLVGDGAGSPRFDRAIGAAYPTGSVFKPVTALAGQAAGVLTPTTTVSDGGCVEIAGREFCNAGDTPYGTVDLRRAVQVSSDVYFYLAGRDLDGMRGAPLQRWSRQLGFGRTTGIDVPGEFKGLVPDRRWRSRVARLEAACERRRRISFPPGCGISDKRPWSVGDNVNLSIGQGDVQATPLQTAVLYAALANGGRIVRPHLAAAVEDRSGRQVQRFDHSRRRRIRLDAATLAAVREGLRASTSQPGGTSVDVFDGWPHDRFPVFGKTGTAERPPQRDQSWYAAYVPHPSRPLVVVVTVEAGGFGGEAAAPATRLILSSWFGVPARFVVGRSHTR